MVVVGFLNACADSIVGCRSVRRRRAGIRIEITFSRRTDDPQRIRPLSGLRHVSRPTLKSGETYYFCGNGCLLRTWLRSMVYLNKPQAEIDRLVVRDYFSGQPVDGRTATWVAGSDVVGPMGPAIIALGDAAQLAAFKNRHGGKTVFTLDQVDDALWKKISRRELPPEKKD